MFAESCCGIPLPTTLSKSTTSDFRNGCQVRVSARAAGVDSDLLAGIRILAGRAVGVTWFVT